MKKIELDKINYSDCMLHFTNTKNLQSIKENGLRPNIGANAKGIENTPKVFFSQSGIGALEIANVWIRWMIFKKQKRNYEKLSTDPNSYLINMNKFYEDFAKGKLFTDEVKLDVYSDFFDIMDSSSYLLLDLVEGSDYKANDVDEAKQFIKRPEVLKAMYGNLTQDEKNPYVMERWNMHTCSDRVITSDKISLLTIDGNYNGLEILKNLYNNVNRENCDLQFLDEFMLFCNEKSKQIDL